MITKQQATAVCTKRRCTCVIIHLDNISIVCVYVYALYVVIQQQTASQGKPTRHPTFYMLIRTHEAQWQALAKRDYEKTAAFVGSWTLSAEMKVNNLNHCTNLTHLWHIAPKVYIHKELCFHWMLWLFCYL